VGQELLLGLSRPSVSGRPVTETEIDLCCLRFTGRIHARLLARALGGSHILADRLPGMARRPGHRRPRLPTTKPFQHCPNLPHGQPSAHRLESGAKMARVAPGGQAREKLGLQVGHAGEN